MAQGTTDPTEKYLEATATPISPVCGSMATMEKVDTVGSACATAAPLATKIKIDNNQTFFINFSRRTPVFSFVPSRFYILRGKFQVCTPSTYASTTIASTTNDTRAYRKSRSRKNCRQATIIRSTGVARRTSRPAVVNRTPQGTKNCSPNPVTISAKAVYAPNFRVRDSTRSAATSCRLIESLPSITCKSSERQ